MELIQKWLSGNKSYIVGRILYGKIGKDDRLKKYFDGNPDRAKKERLERELRALCGQKLAAGKPRGEATEMPESTDDVLEALRKDWLSHYQRMNYFRYELDKLQGNEELTIRQRNDLAKKVLELEQQCIKVWEKRDLYLEKGVIALAKEPDVNIPKDPISLGRLIETTKRNIRRNQAKAKANPEDPKYPALVVQYESLLKTIMKNLPNEPTPDFPKS